jgi:UDP-GlcNAc3NAcA epimerase
VIRYLDAVAADMTVVLPLHPRTKLAAAKFQVSLDALSLCPPLGYLEMTSLLAGAEMVLTDSGGVQKEAYFHRVPCVTLRDETEWVETIDAGWNRLWHEATYQRPKVEIDEYGDGHAAELMADLISKFLRDH